MSDMRHLLEKMNKFAGERVGQKPGDQVRGSEPMPRKGTKKHPYAGRLVGANESSDNLLKELTQVINSDPVKRDLFQEWQEYREGFDSTLRTAADKIVSAGGATRDAIAGAIGSIPRPFDEKEVAKDLQAQKTPPKIDKKVQEEEDEPEEVDVIMRGPADYDRVEFYHRYKDGREERVPHGSYYHDKWYRDFTNKETPMTQELIRGIQRPVKRGPEFVPTEPDTIQDIKVPGQDKGRYRAPLPNWRETNGPISEWGENETPISEYGAPGSGIGNDTATNPAEVFAKGKERAAAKQQVKDQIFGLVAQLQGARAQLVDLNRQFPQGANPVEKAMSLQQMAAQKIGIKKNIENLSAQIAALRQQAI